LFRSGSSLPGKTCSFKKTLVSISGSSVMATDLFCEYWGETVRRCATLEVEMTQENEKIN
jgi:hypothetical protein